MADDVDMGELSGTKLQASRNHPDETQEGLSDEARIEDMYENNNWKPPQQTRKNKEMIGKYTENK